ncbi:MAG: OmpA family protein [Desulfobulbus sp.]|nr:OmpA family protein [Desulfobulbus sp.]
MSIWFYVIFFTFSPLQAADLPGAKDHPLIKRFGGSEIVAYDTKRFVEYDLQTSTYTSLDLDTKKRHYVDPPLHLEGALTRIWYEAAGDTSSLELLRNYRNELTAEGFDILYDSTKDDNATKWTSYLAAFSGLNIQTSRSIYVLYAADTKGLKTLTAKKERPEGDIYVSLITVEWDKNDAVYKSRRGAYAAVDVIEVKPMAQNMVVVKADDMAKSITSDGRVALYGILFDFNKTEIKAESGPVLEEIAKLLKNEPDLNLYVVGHTDSIGSFDFNLNLSKRRAEAVVTALSSEYGIKAGRLTPHGVANLAPVATNATEPGRAKNRRVELVPR